MKTIWLKKYIYFQPFQIFSKEIVILRKTIFIKKKKVYTFLSYFNKIKINGKEVSLSLSFILKSVISTF